VFSGEKHSHTETWQDPEKQFGRRRQSKGNLGGGKTGLVPTLPDKTK